MHHQIPTIPHRYDTASRTIDSDINVTWNGAGHHMQAFCYSDGLTPYNASLPNGQTIRTSGVEQLTTFGKAIVIAAHPQAPEADPIELQTGDTIELDNGSWFAVTIRPAANGSYARAEFTALGKAEGEPSYPRY